MYACMYTHTHTHTHVYTHTFIYIWRRDSDQGTPAGRVVTLEAMARALFQGEGAAELLAAYSAVGTSALFRATNSGDVLVLEQAAAGAGGGGGGGAQISTGVGSLVGGAQKSGGEHALPHVDHEQHLRAEHFVRRLCGRLVRHCQLLLPRRLDDLASERLKDSPDEEADEEFLEMLESLALGTASPIDLPEPLRLLLADYAHALTQRGGAQTGTGATIRETAAAMLVDEGRWRHGDNMHLRRASHLLVQCVWGGGGGGVMYVCMYYDTRRHVRKLRPN